MLLDYGKASKFTIKTGVTLDNVMKMININI